MNIDGHECSMNDGVMRIVEGDSKSSRLMSEFARQFPNGDEPEWEKFLMKHTAMQNKEFVSTRAKFWEYLSLEAINNGHVRHLHFYV